MKEIQTRLRQVDLPDAKSYPDEKDRTNTETILQRFKAVIYLMQKAIHDPKPPIVEVFGDEE